MGMFDTIYVKQSLIDPLIDNEIKSALQKGIEGDTYYFQTKDLENFLFCYSIKEDLKLYVEKHVFEQDETAKFGIKSTIQKQEFCNTITQYIEFYDALGNVGDSNIFITFKAHVINGVVQSIVVHDIEKTPLDKLREQGEKREIRWAKIRADKDFKLADFISRFTWKIEKFYNKIMQPIKTYEAKLRDAVMKRYPFE